ncbi:hypothetical protein [Streptomyces sp. NPDC007369]|uniref:hypothetical protein n=1 Tax=Streptomyces sp. NPDC007369 TaxID=3154589 RepID=UPI0033F38E14
MRREPDVSATFAPVLTGEPERVWLIDNKHTPFCEMDRDNARALVFELGEMFGLFVCDRGAVGEAAE